MIAGAVFITPRRGLHLGARLPQVNVRARETSSVGVTRDETCQMLARFIKGMV